jgi:hypothetical protein
MGFVELPETDVIGRPIYRLSDISSEYGQYGYDLEIVINPQYPDSNANSGIVSIFMPEFSYTTIPEDLQDVEEEFTEEQQARIDANVDVMEAVRQPVAWHVTTLERLTIIVKSLTLKEI